MEKEKVKQYFKSYRENVRALNQERKERERVLEQAASLKGISNDGMPKAKGAHSDPTYNAILIAEQALWRINRNIEDYSTRISTALYLLSLADDTTGKEIIRLRWFEGKSVTAVSQRLYLARTTMHYHQEAAIKEICEKAKD